LPQLGCCSVQELGLAPSVHGLGPAPLLEVVVMWRLWPMNTATRVQALCAQDHRAGMHMRRLHHMDGCEREGAKPAALRLRTAADCLMSEASICK